MKKFLELQKVKKRDCIFVFRTLYTKGTYVTAPKKLLAARKGLKKIRGVKNEKPLKTGLRMLACETARCTAERERQFPGLGRFGLA